MEQEKQALDRLTPAQIWAVVQRWGQAEAGLVLPSFLPPPSPRGGVRSRKQRLHGRRQHEDRCKFMMENKRGSVQLSRGRAGKHAAHPFFPRKHACTDTHTLHRLALREPQARGRMDGVKKNVDQEAPQCGGRRGRQSVYCLGHLACCN